MEKIRHRVSVDLPKKVWKRIRLEAVQKETTPKQLLEDVINQKFKLNV